MLRWCLVMLAMFFVGGHEGLKIGSPIYYWQTGSFLPFLSFVTVLALLLWRLSHIARLRHVSRESVTGTISLAVLAFVILYSLPEPDVGIRLLPTFPWRHTGILASILATVVWLLVLIGIGFTHDAEGDGPLPGLFCTFMFFALTLNAAISCTETTTTYRAAEISVTDKGIDSANYRDEISDWRAQATSLRKQVAQLMRDRRAVSEIISTMERSDLTPPLELTLEREELGQQIDRIQLEIASIENAILRSESNLRRIERKQVAERTLDEAESGFESLATVQRELQDLAE